MGENRSHLVVCSPSEICDHEYHYQCSVANTNRCSSKVTEHKVKKVWQVMSGVPAKRQSYHD